MIASVFFTDVLFKPNINLFPSIRRVSGGQQQSLLVVEGSSVTMGCSIQPQYPGGSFQLTFTGSNTTHNHTQPAVNHSANFLFPAADHTHQGNYSCVYHVNVFNHDFSSVRSESISLTVTGNLNENAHDTLLNSVKKTHVKVTWKYIEVYPYMIANTSLMVRVIVTKTNLFIHIKPLLILWVF